MPNMRRERNHIQKALGAWQVRNGEGILWFEHDADDSQYHDIFNAQGVRYENGIAIPVLWIIDSEAQQQASREGQRNVSQIRFAVPMQTLREVGLSDPQDYERHLNDLVLYERLFYGVGSYSPQGRIERDDIIVGVNAVRVFPEEDMVFDTIPDPEMGEYNHTVRLPGRFLDLYKTWENYEAPASQPTKPPIVP